MIGVLIARELTISFRRGGIHLLVVAQPLEGGGDDLAVVAVRHGPLGHVDHRAGSVQVPPPFREGRP